VEAGGVQAASTKAKDEIKYERKQMTSSNRGQFTLI
jgi:hypothetical protein